MPKLDLDEDRVAELRFFRRLSIEQAAEVLGMADRTVSRDCRKARDVLHVWLAESEGSDDG